MIEKTNFRSILSILFSGFLVGCVANTPQLLNPHQPASSQAASFIQPVDDYGNLRLVVRWPSRSVAGYQTKVIPTTTNALVIWVRQGDTELDKQVIARTEGETTATASFRLKAANNLSLEVRAYRESAPDPDVNTAIAQGTANANVIRAKLTTASVILAPVDVPQIDSLNSNAGIAGDSLTLTGDCFGEEGIPVEVFFNGTPVALGDLTRTSSKSITVKVPTGATTGKVVVKADGVSSTSNMYYWVAKGIEIGAPKATWDTFTLPLVRAVIFGKALDFTATSSWEVNGGDSLELYGTAPQPTWMAEGPIVGTISPAGRYTASNEFAIATVFGKFGSLLSNTVSVQQEGVQLVMNPPSTLFGGRGLRRIPFNARHVFTSGATNSVGIHLQPTQSFIQIENGDGICTSFVSGGYARIWGSSDIDDSLVATVDVDLSNYYSSSLAGSSTQNLNDGTGAAARFWEPSHMAIDSNKTLYVADGAPAQMIRKITQYGVVTTATASCGISAIAMAPDDTLYISGYNKVYSVNKMTGATTLLAGADTIGYLDGTGAGARFGFIGGIAADNDYVYVADTNNQRIRKVSRVDGAVTTIAGDGVAGNVNNSDPLAARFQYPMEMTRDQAGNLYVWDNNNFAIRKIASTGAVTTVKVIGPGANLCGLCVGSDMMLYAPYATYVTNLGTIYGIYKITPDGDCFSIAGGSHPGYIEGGGDQAKYNFSSGVGGIAIDSSGNLYVSDSGNYRIRVLQ